MINGKGGGKPESAQASGSNPSGMKEALTIASDYAAQKLGLEKPVEVVKV